MRKFVLLILAVLIAGASFAQVRRVSGTVTNESGEPIIGAAVSVQGTNAFAVTDADGNYSVAAPANGTLVVAILGMKDQTVAIGNRAVVDVRMTTDAKLIDDVVVVAFGTATKESFTGSAGVVNAEAISKRTSTSVVNTLAGQVAGVQIRTNNGQPGQEAKIRVRGITSINAENDPLIVVDGAPYSGNLSSINSADIESLTVLKDASSTALYGARAANGVIMITTKRARRQEAVINFDAKVGVGTRSQVDYDYVTDPATHYEMVGKMLYNYGKVKGGYSEEKAWEYANANIIKSVLGYNVYDTGGKPLLVNGKLNPDAKLGVVSDKGYYLTPDDWKKEAFKNSLRQEYNLNINGGNDVSSYYFSLGYLSDKGIVSSSKYKRITARFKGDHQVKKWLKMGGNMAYSNVKSSVASGYDETGLSSANVFVFTSRMAPIYPVYIRDGKTKQILHDERGMKRYDYGDGIATSRSRSFLGNANPLSSVQLDDESSRANIFNLTGFAEATLMEGLKLNVTANTYLNEDRDGTFTNPWYGQYATSNGAVYKRHRRDQSINFVQTLAYGKKIGEHNFDVMIGHENYSSRQEALAGSKNQMFGTTVHELNNAVNTVNAASSSVNYNNEGCFLRGQYDYDGKYFGSASYRRDASSRFHPDYRWGNFWSLGGAWLMNREKFLADVSWIDMLKFKASYGQVGNDRIGNFRYVDNYEIVSSNNAVSVVPTSRGNKKITWETKASFNTGFDFELFGGRLGGSLEYYITTTKDQLFLLPTPESTGFPSYYDNIGDMRNSGIELNLSGVALRKRDMRLTINANITSNKNKIISLPAERKTPEQNGFASGNYFLTEGGAMYQWYTPEYAGVDSETGESLWYVSKTDAHMNPTGERTTTNKYSDATQYRKGTAQPQFFGGFGLNYELYGFDLSVNFDYQIGGLSMDTGYASAMRSITGSDGQALHKDLLRAWTPENKNTNIPRSQFADSYTGATSTRFLVSASYLNLQNINLGYTFPQKWTKKIQLHSLRLYVSAENVAYWTRRKGFDPRQQFDGSSVNYIYAPFRTISGGVQVSF